MTFREEGAARNLRAFDCTLLLVLESCVLGGAEDLGIVNLNRIVDKNAEHIAP